MADDAPHILIVEAKFYEDLTDVLAKSAIKELESVGATFERVEVPGAFEIPSAIRFAVDSTGFDGYIALGCVIRGETTHYDYVCGESARGLGELGLHYKAAIGYGIVTVDNREQAEARIFGEKRSAGAAAARACLRMVELKQQCHVIEVEDLLPHG